MATFASEMTSTCPTYSGLCDANRTLAGEGGKGGEREGEGEYKLEWKQSHKTRGAAWYPMLCHLALLHSVTVQVPYLEGSPLFRSVVN